MTFPEVVVKLNLRLGGGIAGIAVRWEKIKVHFRQLEIICSEFSWNSSHAHIIFMNVSLRLLKYSRDRWQFVALLVLLLLYFPPFDLYTLATLLWVVGCTSLVWKNTFTCSHYILLLVLNEIKKLEIIMKGACRSSLVAYVRKCSGSHRNDGLLRNEAAHNGWPYRETRGEWHLWLMRIGNAWPAVIIQVINNNNYIIYIYSRDRILVAFRSCAFQGTFRCQFRNGSIPPE
jgi:hypothetical protein